MKKTVKELLDIQMNGRNTIKEKKNLDSICECIDDLTGEFIGSKRISSLISEQNNEPLMKAYSLIKVYENRILNEDTMTKAAARIMAYDIEKYLKESYDILTKNKRQFNEMDKENISKIYGTLIFEFNALCNRYGIEYNDFIKDEILYEMVSNDISSIIEEVL